MRLKTTPDKFNNNQHRHAGTNKSYKSINAEQQKSSSYIIEASIAGENHNLYATFI